MNVIYQSTFTKVGAFAKDALDEDMLITFKQGAPADLEDYCFIHTHGELLSDVQVSNIAELNGVDYPITAVGSVASFNLQELGHITFRFDAATEAEYPGTIHVVGETPVAFGEGATFKIKQA